MVFFAVFHVTDQQGNKLYDDGIAERIQQVNPQNWYNLFIWYIKYEIWSQ